MNIEFALKLNTFGKERKPFFFVIDYAAKQFELFALEALPSGVLYQLETKTNALDDVTCKDFSWHKTYPNPKHYKAKVEAVVEEIKAGNTYLLNLTAPTKVELSTPLETLFYAANAPFKLCYHDAFICFSPERFVKIEGNCISTYPMKGTIDASIPSAKEIILNDEKEKAEHVMVVDLLRNDLSMVSKEVRVEQFRYVEKIQAGDKELLQVSSKIAGKLDEDWHEKIGHIIATLLPAGSISGTPKRSSVKIIERIEGYDRGFFTGVFGIYDGESFDSAVMIRFLEKTDEGYLFKSGGGITLLSEAQKEYDELCDKVYVPLF
ncbi:aminodeoxychorismate synthase component I [Sulfurospirillum oryzae]|uniref:aminodeoxychorismate synthase component I n=1 Tax=Sulfurospirillum oryzae TaxID=2976535 RepID=UPI0021E817D9|nr:aminodeoxychorismate synthase component I [Sulfurospirillum oryzae]